MPLPPPKKKWSLEMIASSMHLTRCYFQLQLLCQMCNFTRTDQYNLEQLIYSY